jgi:hypothetical protein
MRGKFQTGSYVEGTVREEVVMEISRIASMGLLNIGRCDETDD